MHIEESVKLDFKDVLIRPKRSTLTSRSDVDISREFVFHHSGKKYHGIPIIAANMDTTGTVEMARALGAHGLSVALHKHYAEPELSAFFQSLKKGGFSSSTAFYSMGIGKTDYEKFAAVMAHGHQTVEYVCIDVANGYTEGFINFVKKVRGNFPHLTIMAGNVVTGDMTEELILAGADIVKVGIGPGSVCTTREMTGVGYPQLSAIIECADAAHELGGQTCADGGCSVPGDLAKAFGGAPTSSCWAACWRATTSVPAKWSNAMAGNSRNFTE
jgi:GMP reductase